MSISEWLDSDRNYTAGVKLYEQYGGNSFLKKLFVIETIHTRTRLLQELTDLKISAPQEPVRSKENLRDDFNDLPAAVQIILLKARQLYKEVAAKHAALGKLVDMALERWNPETDFGQINSFLLSNGSEKLAMEIILGEDQYVPMFEQIDYYRKNKTLPEPEPKSDIDFSSFDISKLYSTRNNLRIKISKHKNNEKRAADVIAWKAELVKIQKYIDEPV